MNFDLIYYFFLPLFGVLSGILIFLIFKKLLTRQPILVPFSLNIREKEIRRLAMQIMTGQSSAIIGAFGNERTAILDALRNPELYEDNAERFIFSFLDISTLEKECTQAQFWEYALEKIPDKITNETDSAVFKAYQFCQENNFNKRSLEKLFEQMKQNDWRLVLLINWFEVLSDRPLLKNEAFFGQLRFLASSQNPSSLCLVIALTEQVRRFYFNLKELKMSSPYFNFLESGAITLGALSESEVEQLLAQSGYPFNETERDFLKQVTGGHPYLLQIAIPLLIEVHNTKEEKPIESAKAIFFEKAENIFNNVLQLWTPNIFKAFVSLAKGEDVSDLTTELKELDKQGFVKQENDKWQIRSSVFLDLAKENG